MSTANLLTEKGYKQVPGWPHYWCNQNGDIASTHRRHRGPYYHLKQKTDNDGYLEVALQNSGKRRYFKAHQVIAMTYHGPCPEGQVVNHKDGRRKNNVPENLEYMTPADNERHARQELGKRCVGEKASRSKLDREKVTKIIRLHNEGKTQRAISDEMDISQAQVNRILNKKNWSHVDVPVKKINNRRNTKTWHEVRA